MSARRRPSSRYRPGREKPEVRPKRWCQGLRFPHESIQSINMLHAYLRNSECMTRSFLTGYEARCRHAMRATEVLQKCLGDGLKRMHTQRARTLLHAVEAQTLGHRLTLKDLPARGQGQAHSHAIQHARSSVGQSPSAAGHSQPFASHPTHTSPTL